MGLVNIKRKIGLGLLITFLTILGIFLGFVTSAYTLTTFNLVDTPARAVGFLLFVGPILLFIGISVWISKRLGFEPPNFSMEV